MSETAIIFRKKGAPQAVNPSSSNTTGVKTVRKRAPKDGTSEPSEPLTQKFFASFTERTVMVKFGDTSFGMKKDNGYERVMRNTENKDTDLIIKILDFIKSLMKNNVSFEKICERLNKTQIVFGFSQTIRTYHNALNKELPAAPVSAPINEPATLETHPHINHYGDDNHGTHEDLHI